jgi:hypothetical protein
LEPAAVPGLERAAPEAAEAAALEQWEPVAERAAAVGEAESFFRTQRRSARR